MRRLLLSILFVCAATPASADNWNFSIEPYVMAASITGEATIGRNNGAAVDVDFATILENLDMAAMLHFEAHSDNGWGFSVDYGFMDLSDDVFGSRGGIFDARVRQSIFEGLLIRQSRSVTSGLEYFAGFRWWDNDIDVIVDPAVFPGDEQRKIDASWIDLIVGARWTRDINARWQVQVRGDIGGFGVESDSTYSLAAGAFYYFSDRFALDLQYKGLWVDYEEGKSGQSGHFRYDTLLHGPVVGLKILF